MKYNFNEENVNDVTCSNLQAAELIRVSLHYHAHLRTRDRDKGQLN